MRRQAQLLHLRPDLEIQSLRGNLDTRLAKLEQGDFDAIVVARAGLHRLNLSAPCMAVLAPETFVPAVAQGALGIEYRTDRSELADMLAFMNHEPTSLCVQAERAFLYRLEGGCQVPIACHASLTESDMEITGLVADVQGREVIRRTISGAKEEGEALGLALADRILNDGGRRILQALYLS